MDGSSPLAYLTRLPKEQQTLLARVNEPGWSALTEYLASGDAIAFLGAGASAPLYPLWAGLIGELIDAAGERLTTSEAVTCRGLAADSAEEVVQILKDHLRGTGYLEALRQALRVRTDPESGRSWTAVQELVCRCMFKGIVTTNYDRGIVDARMRVRPGASGTGFITWDDALNLDRWRTGEVFGDAELPVLFAHGQHNRPDTVVLATDEYQRAYAGKLSQVLRQLVDTRHLVWIGFSFADQRVTAILREVAQWSGSPLTLGSVPRHVAVLPWDPAVEGNDPGILAERAKIAYRANIVLYPVEAGDHSALCELLSGLTDTRYPPAPGLPATDSPATITAGDPAANSRRGEPVTWVPGPESVMHFTGRAEELAKLDRWAADPEVSLVGVTAWGGAGKTALVTHWVQEAGGTPRRSAVRGVFGWNFYAESSAERWTATLLEWAKQQFGFQTIKDVRPAIQVLALLQKVPLLLVLDGLEVAQEWSAGDAFGRMLDGTLREVLTGACQVAHGGLVVLTSRFPFADLEAFDGTRARMLDVPPFTLDQGADLLAATGGAWLAEESRRELVQAVDGHALAVGVLARLLAGEPPRSDLQKLLVELAAAMRTDARVQRVLRFYAEQLPEPDRYLIAAISLFTRPVPVATVLIVARHEAFGGWLDGWTPAQVEAAAQDRLTGLVSMQPGNMLSAHPLVRDSFRRFVIGAAQAAVDITLSGLPDRPVTNRADAERLVEAIELLLEAEDWQAADNLYSRRTDSGEVWKHLPAARLGQRASIAFVADPARREACSQHLGRSRMASYLSRAGLCAMNAGDLPAAQEFFQQGIHSNRDAGDAANLSQDLQNLTECLGHLGKVDQASETSVEALAEALKLSDPWLIFRARSFNAWATALHGDTIAAGKQFSIADREHFTDKRTSHHLCSLWGVMWGEFLTATGRSGPAYMLTNRNRTTARQNHWNVDVALCDRLLGRISLISGDVNTASHKFASSTDSLRDGDYLVELATTLADLAECAGIAGELDAAENYIEEALLIAAPRGLVPAQSAALATRARIFANRATATGSRDLTRGRDAADAALRLAQRHHLLWNELAALRAHAYIDEVEGDTRGWAARTETLYKQLVPPKLDPNPLVTVERQVHKQSVKGESRNPNSKRNSRRQAEKSRRQNRRRRK